MDSRYKYLHILLIGYMEDMQISIYIKFTHMYIIVT